MGYLQYGHGTVSDCPDSSGKESNVVGVFTVNNYKQLSQAQHLHVYPQATHWELCFYFSGAVFYALSEDTGDYIFPRFSNEARRVCKSDGRNDSSGVSKLWRQNFSAVMIQIQKLREVIDKNLNHLSSTSDPQSHLSTQSLLQFLEQEVTPGLCSHSGKKYAVSEMGRNLNPIYLIFRAGWEVRNVHTMFDYLTKDEHHDIKAAKTCAGWRLKLNDDNISAGLSNTINDLGSEPNTIMVFNRFLSALFRNQYNRYVQGLCLFLLHMFC